MKLLKREFNFRRQIMKRKMTTTIDEKRKKMREYSRKNYHLKIKNQVQTHNNNKPWTRKEIKIAMRADMTARQKSEKIGRSIMAIYSKMRQEETVQLVTNPRARYKHLTPEEKSYIKNNYPKMRAKEIAVNMGVPLQKIYDFMIPDVQKEKKKETQRNWRQNNPEYNKNYYEANKKRK